MFVTIVAIIGFLASIVLVPWIIVQIPSDYFTHPKRQKYFWSDQLPIVRVLFLFLKNALGIVLLIAGIIMLVLPGQGILTIIAGVFFMDFPGKYKVEKRIIKHPVILRSINWLRKKAKRSPLEIW